MGKIQEMPGLVAGPFHIRKVKENAGSGENNLDMDPIDPGKIFTLLAATAYFKSGTVLYLYGGIVSGGTFNIYYQEASPSSDTYYSLRNQRFVLREGEFWRFSWQVSTGSPDLKMFIHGFDGV